MKRGGEDGRRKGKGRGRKGGGRERERGGGKIGKGKGLETGKGRGEQEQRGKDDLQVYFKCKSNTEAERSQVPVLQTPPTHPHQVTCKDRICQGLRAEGT